MQDGRPEDPGKPTETSLDWKTNAHNCRDQELNPGLIVLLDTVTTWWLDYDSVVIIVNCWQHSDYNAIGSSVNVLPAVINSDYTVTTQSLCNHCV